MLSGGIFNKLDSGHWTKAFQCRLCQNDDESWEFAVSKYIELNRAHG